MLQATPCRPLLTVFLLAGLLTSPTFAQSPDLYEPNDLSRPTPIALPLLTGVISLYPAGDVDAFSFTAASGTLLSVDIAPVGSPPFYLVSVLDPTSPSPPLVSGATGSVVVSLPNTGTYYVVIEPIGATVTGEYTLVLTTMTAAPPTVTCLNPTVVVPDTATNCGVCPNPDMLFSVSDPLAQCVIEPSCPYPLLTTTFQVTCASKTGSASATCAVTGVEDPPKVSCPNVSVACTGTLGPPPEGRSVCSSTSTQCVIDGGIAWSDYTPALGDTTYQCTATSSSGASSSCSGTIGVSTNVPPIVNVHPGPIMLWPPNHRMQAIDLDDCVASAVDACTGAPIDVATHGAILRVESDELEDAAGDGDGHTCQDIVIVSPSQVQVRKERDGNSNGRVYTIHFAVSDNRGSTTEASCQATVLHSLGGALAVNDGVRYCVGTGCTTASTCGQ